MKKIISFFAFLILSTQAEALSYKAFCEAKRGKVGISLTSYKDRLYLRYTNFDGAKEFPIYEGTVTKSSMVFIKLAEKELAELDQEVQVSWPIENCQFNERDPRLMECNGEARFDLPLGTNLRSFTFFTSVVREETNSYNFETFKIRWGIEGQDFHHQVAMPFDPSRCSVEYIK